MKVTPKPTDSSHTIAIAAVSAAISCQASAIILLTTTGRYLTKSFGRIYTCVFSSAHLCSRYKPCIPIIAVSRNLQVARQLHLYRGVFPLYYPERDTDWPVDVDNRIHNAMSIGKERGFIRTGDFAVIITGWRQGAGYTNTVRLIQAP